jgi:A/G-specific adenine glycosylase
MKLSTAEVQKFQKELMDYYAQHGRHSLPWRLPEANGSFDPYKILVSEIMLQQTQVPRVIPKYHGFLAMFPTAEALARAELGQVIRAWSGLGYNRRAKYFHETAKAITTLGYFPQTITQLVKLPGVGKNTAGAVLAYAFNQPALFIETNIRTAYIYHFFSGQMSVTDTAIIDLLEQTLDEDNPREFYWGLMDYGSFLKTKIGNLNKLSKNYSKQSSFHGSKRQIRGQLLKLLAEDAKTLKELKISIADERLQSVLEELTTEGLIRRAGQTYHL